MQENGYMIYWTASLLYLSATIMSTLASAQIACTNASNDNISGGSCDFQIDGCGYQTEADNVGPQWYLYKGFTNHFAYVRMERYDPGSTANLASPWLCPTGGERHTLSFKYYVSDNGQCQLSVYLKGANDVNGQQIWNTTRSERSGFSNTTPPLSILSRGSVFQIVIKAKTLPNANRRSYILLDTILYKKLPTPSTTNTPTLPSATSTGETSSSETSAHNTSQVIIIPGSFQPGETEALTSSTRPTSGAETAQVGQTGSEGSFGIGAVIGIIIGIISTISIVVFIVFFLRRQHNNAEKCPSLFTLCTKDATRKKHISQAASNSAYSSNTLEFSGPQVATTDNGVPAYELSSVLQRDEDSPYEVSSEPSAALYSKPMKSRADPNGPVLQVENDYNKLTHKTPRAKPVGHHTKHSYDHLDHQDTKTAPVQLTSTSEYSLARMDNEISVFPISVIRDGHETVPSKSDGKTNYVNVNPGVKTPPQTTDAEYNRLDLDQPQKAKATSLEKTGGHEVYSHLHGEDSEYHQLDFDHDHPQNAREHDDNTDGQDMYHHLQADAQVI